MNCDIEFFKSLINCKDTFSCADSVFSIVGSNKTHDLGIKLVSGEFKGLQMHLFEPSYSSNLFSFRNVFYKFNDSYMIKSDSIYKILSTLAFDWNYKCMMYALMRCSKCSINDILKELKEKEEVIFNELIKLVNLYFESPLYFAKDEETNDLEGNA